MTILESISSSDDVKKLEKEQLEPLCRELRALLVSSVAKTGGHLASNLGAVELSVALHRVYDSSRDRIVFDVGHQSYIHKILTGRRERMDTLRQYQGLSGYPKPHESPDDAFIAGHASNSVSVALGMARARTLLREDYDVVAVIGDGAMTGGLAYEGLVNAAASGEPLVILLNDNKMSISENVGGTASLLQKLRVRPGYLKFKRAYRSVFLRLPALYRFNHAIKEALKSWLLPENIFSEMGLTYLGPVDGHDVKQLETVLRWARDLRTTVLVHAVTTKGKGCDYAEKAPERYHGVGRFNAETGEVAPSGESFSDRFGAALCHEAEGNGRIAALTAAMSEGTQLSRFAERFPERFFDVGIAEGHAVSMAAGMAKQGLLPVFAVYSSFLQRGYDMLLHDVALLGLHCVFAVDRAGLVGSDGETHHGVFDLAYLGSVPGMTILCPASFSELEGMLHKALVACAGPVALRYPRGGEGSYRACSLEAETLLREGTDLTLISYGTLINEAMAAAEALEESGVSVELIKIGQIQPNDFALSLASLKKTGRLLTVEEVCRAGSLGERLLAISERERLCLKGSRSLDLGEGIVSQGSVRELWHEKGLDAEGLITAARQLMEDRP